MPEALRETPLADAHRAAGARMVEFGGWNMPVQYTSLIEEHHRTRNSCSLFDVSHMGRVKLTGPDAIAAIQRLCPVQVEGALAEGQSTYNFLLNDEGGTLDDLLITRDLDGIGLVINASNRLADLEWMRTRTEDLDVRFLDMTEETCMIAVQGPKAVDVVRPLCGEDPGDLAYYHARVDTIDGQLGIVSRTGYTGEDGFELTVPAGDGAPVWQRLLAAGAAAGVDIAPAGLGARDTLRLEAAMPLHGHELSPTISPVEAGLKRFLDLQNESFIGRDTITAQVEGGTSRKCVCLKGSGRKIPREGAVLLRNGEQVGVVTSGTFSPTFQVPIAMGLVAPNLKRGAVLQADVRGKQVDVKIVRRPFYRRES